MSTLSLIPDIGWIAGELFGGGETDALKAGKASRAGSKAGRIVRVVRLVRMIRIVRLYKIRKDHQDDQDEEEMTVEEQIAAEPSKVGKRLTELTTRRVIILVLAMIIFTPFMEGNGILSDSSNEYQNLAVLKLHHLAQDMHSLHTSGNVSDTAYVAYMKESIQVSTTAEQPV
jgi:hypothetical protein